MFFPFLCQITHQLGYDCLKQQPIAMLEIPAHFFITEITPTSARKNNHWWIL
jgi:hypothetical protein